MTTKEQISEAAAKLFAANGFERTSVDEIAAKTKVAKGSFYYHFKSKEELLFALIEAGIDNVTSQISESIAKEKTSSGKIDKLIEIQINYFNTHRDLCRIIFSELWRIESYWKRSAMSIQKKYIRVIKTVIADGIKDKTFRSDLDPAATTTVLFGLISASVLDWAIFHPEINKKTMVKTIRSMILSGIAVTYIPKSSNTL
jgi:AcrR family transcriptional regulator